MARHGAAAAVACALLLAQLLVGPLATAGQPQQGRRLLASPPPSADAEHQKDIVEYIARHQRPAQRTIHTEHGDVVDCVKIADQHTMQDARFKDHKIEMKPPSLKASDDGKVNGSHAQVKQTWGSCPEGTIPVRRLTYDEVARAGSLPDFFKKHPKGHGGGHQPNKGPEGKSSTVAPGNETLTAGMKKGSGNTTRLNYVAIQPPSYAGHEYAIAEYTGTSEPLYGTMATFNVWNPLVEWASEFSLSQLWLVAGSIDNGDLNTMEGGWQLYPNKYGDLHSRLFNYWTRDAYKSTGCYNLDCSGFVQTNIDVLLGGVLTASWYGSTQYEYTLLDFKSPRTGHWWLQFQGQWVGYWPWWIFNRLAYAAEAAHWGGEVMNIEPYRRHTRTTMGSGNYASKGWSYAAYIRNIRFVNHYNVLNNLDYALSSYTSNSNCYSIWLGANPGGWEACIYFGGLGLSSICV